MKTNNSRYRAISSLKDIECEKKLIQYKLERKEKMIEQDWDAIHDAWSFVSIAGRVVSNIAEYIPVGMSVISSVRNLFRKSTKQSEK